MHEKVPGKGKHRRRHPRTEVGEPVEVLDVVADTVLGTLGNISSHGLMLISGSEIEENRVFQLEFEISHGDEARTINAGAHCLWCSPANAPGRYWSGFEIVDISDVDEAFLNLVTVEAE